MAIRLAKVIEQAGRGEAKVLAKKLNVSESYLCDVRYGRRGIGTETARKIAGLK